MLIAIYDIAEINRINTAFWAEQQKLLEHGLADESLREAAFEMLQDEALRRVPVYNQKSIYAALADAQRMRERFIKDQAREAGTIEKPDALQPATNTLVDPDRALGWRFKERQRERARKPRAMVTDDGETMMQVVDRLVSKPEHRDDTAQELWPHLFAELSRLDLEPIEMGVFRKSSGWF